MVGEKTGSRNGGERRTIECEMVIHSAMEPNIQEGEVRLWSWKQPHTEVTVVWDLVLSIISTDLKHMILIPNSTALFEAQQPYLTE